VAIALVFFGFGLVFGSFFGVLADRLPQGKSPLVGRSRCDSCGHELGPLDLIPVLSYIATRGRCRYCGARVALFYPAIELTTGAAYALAYLATTALAWPLPVLAGLLVAESVVIVLVFARLRPNC
jgi:prepilin signal peptidase PulO-like enzyme (type II secretory pathway)